MFAIFLIFAVCSAATDHYAADGRFSQSLKNFPQQVLSNLQYQHDLGAGGDDDECMQCAEVDIPVIYASASNVLAGEIVDELTDGSYVSVGDCISYYKECMVDCGNDWWGDVCGLCLLGI